MRRTVLQQLKNLLYKGHTFFVMYVFMYVCVYAYMNVCIYVHVHNTHYVYTQCICTYYCFSVNSVTDFQQDLSQQMDTGMTIY